MPVRTAVRRQIVPAVISQMIALIYSLADTYFVGLLNSPVQTAAVTVSYSSFVMLTAISNLFGVGGAGVISRCLGRRETRRASDTSAFAIWGCCALAAVYSLGCLIFVNAFVDLLGGRDVSVHPLARSYLTVTVVICMIPALLRTFSRCPAGW
jgi:Na+-driven multidrug efflux pump